MLCCCWIRCLLLRIRRLLLRIWSLWHKLVLVEVMSPMAWRWWWHLTEETLPGWLRIGEVALVWGKVLA